jgi:predicted MFS family arabinose efflux permease
MSMPSLVVAVGALIAGYLVDRRGDRPVLLIGAIVAILGDILVILSPTLSLLLAARLFTGIGYVLVAVSAVTILIRITAGKQRTAALSLWSTFVPMSFILPFLFVGLVMHFGAWRMSFSIHASLTFILMLMAFFWLPGRQAGAFQPLRTHGLKDVLRSPLPYLLGLSFATDSFLQTGLISSLAPYLSGRYGGAPADVQVWNVVAMCFNIAGCLLVGRLLNRGVPVYAIAMTGICVAAASIVAIYALSIGVMGSVFASWSFMFGSGLLVGMWALVPACAPSPDSIGATSGLVTQITLFGVLIGPPLYFAGLASGSATHMLLLGLVPLVGYFIAVPAWLHASRHLSQPQNRDGDGSKAVAA